MPPDLGVEKSSETAAEYEPSGRTVVADMATEGGDPQHGVAHGWPRRELVPALAQESPQQELLLVVEALMDRQRCRRPAQMAQDEQAPRQRNEDGEGPDQPGVGGELARLKCAAGLEGLEVLLNHPARCLRSAHERLAVFAGEERTHTIDARLAMRDGGAKLRRYRFTVTRNLICASRTRPRLPPG